MVMMMIMMMIIIIIITAANFHIPISSKRIELSGAPVTEVGQSHSQSTMQTPSTNDQMQ